MTTMPRPRPPYLHSEPSRHGSPRWYVRIGKGPRIRIRGEFGTAAFKASYEAAIRGEPLPAAASIYPAQSLGWLIARYRESTAWTALSLATRRQRENIFKHIVKAEGTESYSRVTKAAIVAGRDRRKATPNAARHFIQTMHGLFDWAVEAQHAEIDPTVGVKAPRPESSGFAKWPQEWHDKFKKRWALGTRPRVAYAVAYCTGLRRGDLVTVGRQHIKGNRGALRTEKNKIVAHFPFDAEAQEAVNAGPVGDLTFIASEAGNPITKESLGNSFREWCDKADVPGSLHGLRKAKASYVAERGGTEAELDAMFGWKRGSGTSAIYTRDADTERLAAGAIARLEQKTNVYSRTSGSGAGVKAKKKAKSNG